MALHLTLNIRAFLVFRQAALARMLRRALPIAALTFALAIGQASGQSG